MARGREVVLTATFVALPAWGGLLDLLWQFEASLFLHIFAVLGWISSVLVNGLQLVTHGIVSVCVLWVALERAEHLRFVAIAASLAAWIVVTLPAFVPILGLDAVLLESTPDPTKIALASALGGCLGPGWEYLLLALLWSLFGARPDAERSSPATWLRATGLLLLLSGLFRVLAIGALVIFLLVGTRASVLPEGILIVAAHGLMGLVGAALGLWIFGASDRTGSALRTAAIVCITSAPLLLLSEGISVLPFVGVFLTLPAMLFGFSAGIAVVRLQGAGQGR